MPDPWSAPVAPPAWEPAARHERAEPIVTVLTPTIESRFELLHEAAMSVRNQTLRGVEHDVLLDAHGDGPAATRNLLLAAVTTPYVAFLDDDDLLDADHCERLLRLLEATHADVAYSWHRSGPATPRPRRWHEATRLMRGGRNVIPVTVLAKTASIIDAGGFDPADRYEDYSLWLRMIERGCAFALEPAETWTYRLSTDGRTYA